VFDMGRIHRAVPIAAFLMWVALIGAGLLAATVRGGSEPVDYQTYHQAAAALARGASIYQTPARSLALWRSYHRLDAAIRAGHTLRAAGGDLLGRTQPGPYLYLPTLALVVWQLHLTAAPWEVLDLACVVAFPLLWLRWARASWWWLLLVAGSWDVWSAYTGGNVEGLLLAATLVAARLLWPPRPLGRAAVPLAAVLIAFVLLAKPFYALFFVAFGVVLLLGGSEPRRVTRRTLATVAGLVVALLVGEVIRWGPMLRADALHYIAHTLDAQWFVLPVTSQTPMSAWNRTPLQAFITLGLPAAPAQFAAGLVWLAALVASARLVRGRRLSFAPAFALAFALLYIGRPVGWTLVYLDLVVCVVVWPSLPRAGRAVLLVAVLALLASHWVALVLTGLGDGLPLLTLQPADRPWETWIVLPVAWALAVWAARHFISQNPAAVSYQDPVSGAMTTAGLATVTFRDRP